MAVSHKKRSCRREVPMDVDKMKKEGRCYNCGKTGHRFFECPEPKKSKARAVEVREEEEAPVEEKKEFSISELRRMMRKAQMKKKKTSGTETAAASSSEPDF